MCWGLTGSGTPPDTKITNAQVPYIKWLSICIYPLFAYKLQQGTSTHLYKLIQQSAQHKTSKFRWFASCGSNYSSVQEETLGNDIPDIPQKQNIL